MINTSRVWLRFNLIVSLVVGFVFMILLSGCATIKKSPYVVDRDTTYLSAQSIPPLKMPPGVTYQSFKSYYPVSERQYASNKKTVTITPPGLNEKA